MRENQIGGPAVDSALCGFVPLCEHIPMQPPAVAGGVLIDPPPKKNEHPIPLHVGAFLLGIHNRWERPAPKW